MKIFDVNGPVIVFLGKVADLMWLNILTLICCIPIFTAGASITAMHYVALKIVRDEECYITRSFFKSFKENLKQATILWLILLVVVVFVVADFQLVLEMEGTMRTVCRAIIMIAAILILCTATYVFPLLAKFDNGIRNTIKNAFLISIMLFPRTIIMIVLNVVPVALVIFSFDMVPMVLLFGMSLPALAAAFLYNGFFKKLENQILEANAPAEEDDGEDERIFKDEPDESIVIDK